MPAATSPRLDATDGGPASLDNPAKRGYGFGPHRAETSFNERAISKRDGQPAAKR
jgi:hypothetical protein